MVSGVLFVEEAAFTAPFDSQGVVGGDGGWWVIGRWSTDEGDELGWRT